MLSDTNQTMEKICSHPKDLSMITENNRDDHVDDTALEYEENLSDLAAATQSYSSTEVVPKSSVKWSNPGHFPKAQGKLIFSFPCALFLHIFDT